MFILNDCIWVLQTKKDTLFDVFDLHDYRYLYSTGTKGSGPDDFVFPMEQTIQVTDNGFTIFDGYTMKTMELQSKGSLHTILNEKIFDVFPVNGFAKLNDSLCIAFADCSIGTTGDFEYQIKNTFSKKIIKVSEYPNLTINKYDQDQRCQIYSKYVIVSPTKEKFAAFYSYFKFFRIYSIEGNLEKEIHVNIAPYSTNDLDDWTKRNIYYRRPVPTEKYIYAPCSSNEIQIWDWNGNPVMQYFLDRNFHSFAVSEKLQKLYTISYESEDKIFVYDLSH
jgi:hypothetical protein